MMRWPRPSGHVPRELRVRSERLQRALADPAVLARLLDTAPKQPRPGSPEAAMRVAMRQHMAPDLEARLAVAKSLVQLLQRFKYEETGAIATLLLALDADEAVWILAVQTAAELLQALLEAVKEDQAEELYAYGVKESEMPELIKAIQETVAPYLR